LFICTKDLFVEAITHEPIDHGKANQFDTQRPGVSGDHIN
jgi:hypothetical protein